MSVTRHVITEITENEIYKGNPTPSKIYRDTLSLPRHSDTEESFMSLNRAHLHDHILHNPLVQSLVKASGVGGNSDRILYVEIYTH